MKFEKSNDTRIIESVLVEAKVGQIVTYEELSKAIGRDVRIHARPSLQSARRAVLNAHGIVFSAETNEGLRRLDDSQIVDASEEDRAKMRRAAGRAIKKLSVVDFGQLPEDKKRKHIVMSAQIGAIEMFAAKSATKKIESKVDGTKSTLAIGETLKMFG